MRCLLTWLRFSLVVLSMTIMIVAVVIVFPFSPQLVRNQIRKMWSSCLIAASGAQLHVYGYKLTPQELSNTLIVANHISWLDTVVMLRLAFVQFIGKSEMLQWPILSNLIKAGGTIFIDRKNKKSLLNINQQVAGLLQNGATIGLFPEGKTSVGKEVLSFKTPLFEAALIAKSTIIPMVLSYRKNNNQLAREASFAKVGWLTTVLKTLRLRQLKINLTILAPVQSCDFANREQLAAHLYQLISECYHQQQL